MLSVWECILKAENFAMAAKMAEGRKRMALLGAAAFWRNRALDQQMERFKHLRETADSVPQNPTQAD
jgi:hypothetical protein